MKIIVYIDNIINLILINIKTIIVTKSINAMTT